MEKPEHKQAARMLSYALTLGDHDAWFAASAIWTARLDAPERAALAFSALKSLDYYDALLTAESVLMRGAGMPIAPLFNYMDEATFWADMSEPDELDAVCLAGFNRMQPDRQSAFNDHINRREAA